jgi:hypothetical protein
MRPTLFILFILSFLLLTSATYVSGETNSEEIAPLKTYKIYRLPQDPVERAKALHELSSQTSESQGVYFSYTKIFRPVKTEQTSLRPGIVLSIQSSSPFTQKGYVMVHDPYGLRTREESQKTIDATTYSIRNIFAGSNRIFQTIAPTNGTPIENLVNASYLGFDGKGSKFFMDSIFLRGVIMGPRMEQLLKDTNATRIGFENIRGTRTIVYSIQPTQQDFRIGYRYLKVWVRVGDSKLERTDVELDGGYERYEYSQHLTNIKFTKQEQQMFLLPNETVTDMEKECEKVLFPEKDK